MVTDLWQRKGKISGYLKNSASVVLEQCKNKVSFQGKDCSVVSKFLLEPLKGLAMLSLIREHFLPFNPFTPGYNLA